MNILLEDNISEYDADMIIVGAGLSGLLTAWRCLDVNSDMKILVLEASGEIAGDHTWSFNLTDVDAGLRDWIKPFIAHQWAGYDVKFPSRERQLDIPYCTGNSHTLRHCLQSLIIGGRLRVKLNSPVQDLQTDHVILEGGQKLSAKWVLDARGFKPNDDVVLGYQKFVGHVIKTKSSHGLERPIIMDATVEQLGGYRFVYCLPFSDTELLVEDTYYTDGAELKSQQVDARIKDYIRENITDTGYELVRREKGVLPITLAVKDLPFPDQAIGIRGGYYNAVTGYSFPDALRTADNIAKRWSRSLEESGTVPDMTAALGGLTRQKKREESFLRLLNRMLFRAAKPEERYLVLQRFYGLNQGLIERFYAGHLKWYDKLRILIGKPPVPVTKALYNFSEKTFIKREKTKRDSR